MLLQINDVLGSDLLSAIQSQLQDETFVDGRTTAGWHAREVKHNEQMTGKSLERLSAQISEAVLAHPVFRAAAQPKAIVRILVSRYRPGMSYGTHVDDALVNGARTDLSFTCFLSEPSDYDGGELVIDAHDGTAEIKMPAGGLVLYPSTSLHRVAEVTRGERLVAAGWVRSFIRSPDQREILFDLDNLIAAMRTNGRMGAGMEIVLKVRSNLLRMWVED